MVVFIYHGSSGVAGGYSAKFVEGLAMHSHVHAFVNCGYVYKHDHSNIKISRVFFPITDRYLTRQSLLRRAIRFFELALAYMIVLTNLFFVRAQFVIYNPITNLRITAQFAILVKHFCGCFAVVVHDAQSHYDISEKYRDAVFTKADFLIVHNEHSRQLIKDRLPASGEILLLPFPWSLSKLPIHKLKPRNRILFIGHVRPSKGIDFLLAAYSRYVNSGGNMSLAIAGLMGVDIYEAVSNVASDVVNKNLDDQEFLDLIVSSNFLVMPYRPGYSNSSVHYCAVIHCGVPFICSDIELFSKFENYVDCLKFTYGDLESFSLALKVAEGLNDLDRMKMALNAYKKMSADMDDFDLAVNQLTWQNH